MARTAPKRPKVEQNWLELREQQLDRIASLYARLERELAEVEMRFQLDQPLPSTRSLRRRKPR